jgi:hypothetical protein
LLAEAEELAEVTLQTLLVLVLVVALYGIP